MSKDPMKKINTELFLSHLYKTLYEYQKEWNIINTVKKVLYQFAGQEIDDTIMDIISEHTGIEFRYRHDDELTYINGVIGDSPIEIRVVRKFSINTLNEMFECKFGYLEYLINDINRFLEKNPRMAVSNWNNAVDTINTFNKLDAIGNLLNANYDEVRQEHNFYVD